MTKPKEMVGYKNEFITVLEFLGTGRLNSPRSYRFWRCLCRCGKEMRLNTEQITAGIPRGCCFKQERPGNKKGSNFRHGLAKKGAKHPLFIKWQAMKARCLNEKNVAFKYYGGKGITLCDSWLKDFKAFYDWCHLSGWKPGLTIDRIDSNKGYSPENCRLISHSENSRGAKKKPEGHQT